MSRHIRQALLAAALTLAGATALGDVPNGIHVAGRGTVEVAPDMGYVTLDVRREGADAASLKEALDAVVRDVLSLTRKLKIAERDVTATAVSITPRYQRRDNEVVVDGLIATRTIEVTLRDLDRFGALLDGALDLGINNLSPLRPDTSKRTELEEQALTLAMDDARREAERVAAGFGVTLGAVSDVQVDMHSPRPMEMKVRTAAFADAGGAEYSTGVISIERTLSATFSIIAGQ
ncbi:MAG: SIMPL domain-containing protein [Pseudomonadales bacterium]|jgi:hypothetical protein